MDYKYKPLYTILFIQKASGTRQGLSIRSFKADDLHHSLVLSRYGFLLFCNDVCCHAQLNLFDKGSMMNPFLFVGFYE
jgi:hypothetical protein